MTRIASRYNRLCVMVMGLPGSGKSFFAAKLASCIHARYLNSDRIRNEMYDVKTYSPRERINVYKRMLELAIRALAQHEPVVLDATFYSEEIRQQFLQNLKNLAKAIVIIEITADENTIKKRLAKKRPDSDADFEVYLKIKRAYEPVTMPHLKLQSKDNNIEQMISQALAYIQKAYDTGGN